MGTQFGALVPGIEMHLVASRPSHEIFPCVTKEPPIITNIEALVPGNASRHRWNDHDTFTALRADKCLD
jgi:hypothetical protein